MGWPEPPAPRAPLEWTRDDERWTAVGPGGTPWRVQPVEGGQWAMTAVAGSHPSWRAASREEAFALVDRFEARLDDPALAALGMTWDEAAARLDESRAAAEAQVHEWAWGSWRASWERLEPFWDEQHGERPVKRRSKTRIEDGKEYGFDATGRVMVCRDPTANGRETLRHGELLLVARSGKLAELHVPHYRDGLLERLDRHFREGFDDGHRWWGATYEYDGAGRLVTARERQRESPRRDWERHRIGEDLDTLGLSRASELRLRHDEAGLLTIALADGLLLYRRQAAGAARRATKLIREQFPERIAAWANRTAPDAPLASLVIRYAESYQQPLPPGLALGTVGDIGAHGADAIEYAGMDFEPAELNDSPELLEAYQALHQQWLSTDDLDGPRKLLTAVAKDLAKRDWSDLRIAPGGLAVFAIDFELGDLERNLRASVPAPLRRALTR